MLHCSRYILALDRPLIMGIVNVTPDSFSDGGAYLSPSRAIEHAYQLRAEGADIIDIGGESSRPGAQPVSAEQELARILPVLDGLREIDVPVSVDTVKPEVMRAAIEAGATFINDISALRAPGALQAIADSDVAVCLMHMQGEPRDMQSAPRYGDVVAEVKTFLAARIRAALDAGIARERMVIDPGYGFGKKLEHNLALLRELPHLLDLGVPVLAGWSRKSSLGAIIGNPTADRLAASVAAALLAAQRGAKILRVHDVASTRDAMAVWQAVERSGQNQGDSNG